MTPKQYKKLKEIGILSKEYELINGYLDMMGYSPYQDGAGDYGIRRLRDGKGRLISEIRINDMIPIRGEYPNFQFYDIIQDEIIGIDYLAILNTMDRLQ